MDYKSSLGLLLGLVDFERFRGPRGSRVKFDLSRMQALLQSLDNPHLSTPTVHVAGTKGKGSTAAMVTSILARQGYTTGIFTSPHLHTFRERIGVNGVPVTEEEFSSLLESVWPHVEKVSWEGTFGSVTLFETLTAMAFLHFQRVNAHFQVMEVGLGGRLDSTNLVVPRVCAITSLSLDHTAILGETIDLIAREKAGIVKPGTPVVTAPQESAAMTEICSACRRSNAPLWKVGSDITWESESHGLWGQSFSVNGRLRRYNLWTPLLGDHQMENAAVAVGVIESLIEQGWTIEETALKEGFSTVSWPCRLEVLEQDPLLLSDGAHNPHSMARLCASLTKYFQGKRPVIIFGASRGKNLGGMMAELADLNPLVIAAVSRHPRAVPTEELAREFALRGVEVSQVENVTQAVERAKAVVGDNEYILATGSLFLAAEVREVVLGLEPEIYTDIDMSSSVLEPADRRL